jgi:hypothetical protein
LIYKTSFTISKGVLYKMFFKKKEKVNEMHDFRDDKIKAQEFTKNIIYSSEDLLPSNYQPKVKNCFILNIEGIDHFLVRAIDREEWKPSFLNLRRGEVTIEMNDAIAPSGEQQIREWMLASTFLGRMKIKNQYKGIDKILLKDILKRERRMELCLIDRYGTIISKIMYNRCKLKSVKFDKMTYEYLNNPDEKTVRIKIVVSFSESVCLY